MKNILAIRNDRFGEFLLNIPALNSLKKSFPQAKLTVIVNPYVAELAKYIPSIDEIIGWSDKKHGFFELLQFSRRLKNKHFDLCIILNPSKESHIISFLSGIPIRAGYNRKWPFLLNKKIKDTKNSGQKHEVEYNLDLIKIVNAQTLDKTLSIKLEDNIISSSINKFKMTKSEQFIAIHPWTSDYVKQWPLENFQNLAIKIADELKIKVVIVGGIEEELRSKHYFESLGNNLIVNLTGKTNLVELAALLQKCKLLISGDSGPVHLASAVNSKAIVIFRNDLPGKTPKRWGPWGDGHIVIESDSLAKITPEEVFIKVKGALSNV